MSFTDGYLKEITMSDGTTTYTVPVWNLKVWAEPWHSSGNTHLEYFYGKNVHRIQGYQLKCEMDLHFAHDGLDNQSWSDLLNDIAAGVEWTIDFEPTSAGIRTAVMVLDDSDAVMDALFTGHIRNRPMRSSWIGASIVDTLPWWITCEEDPDFLLDPEDVILYTPDSVQATSGTVENWENLGFAGAPANMDTKLFGSDVKPVLVTDPNIGNIVGVRYNQSGGINTSLRSDDGSISDNDFDPTGWELWLILRERDSVNIGQSPIGFHIAHPDSGQPTYWGVRGNDDKMGVAIVGENEFQNSPASYGHGSGWHVFRQRVYNPNDAQSFFMNGFFLGYGAADGSLTPIDSGIDSVPKRRPAIGRWSSSGGHFHGDFALIKMSLGQLDAARTRQLYAYFRDTWGINNVPDDDTLIGMGYASPEQSYLIFDSVEADGNPFALSAATLEAGYQMRFDQVTQTPYTVQGRNDRGRVVRYHPQFGAQSQTDLSVTGSLGRGLALDLTNNEKFYVTRGVDGTEMYSHSSADSGAGWVEMIDVAVGYEMHEAIEYHPTDNLVYFIDSAAGNLRSIHPDGTSDTLVAPLTASKVYSYLTLNPDDNVLYFTNETDGTIEAYDLDTGTHTTSWHTPTNTPYGMYYWGGSLWYIEDTTYKIYEVDVSSPAGKTEMTDIGSDSGSATYQTSSIGPFSAGTERPGGIWAMIFDTTIT